MAVLAAGAATRDVTPDWPVSLAGFASRTGPSEGARHPLHVRVIVLDSNGSRIVIAGTDILNWGAQQAPRLRAQLAELAGTTPDRVLLAATHSHSGPQTSFGVSKGVGVADQRFIDLLDRETLAAARDALASLEPVTVKRAETTYDLGFYRRVSAEPGPVDNRLTVVQFTAKNGVTKAVLVHYTCHPVIVAEHFLSPEFPGFAMSRLERERTTTSLYLQGFCGDINPNFDGRRHSNRGNDADVQQIGNQLADLVLGLLDEPGETLDPIALDGEETIVELPFQELPDNATLRVGLGEPGVVGEWSQMMLDHPEKRVPTAPLTIQRLDLAMGLSLLAINAEMSVDYGLRLRDRTDNRVLPVGYSNGMVGYVTTARQIGEGGYEPVESSRYYGLPAPFAPEIEPILESAIGSLVV